MNLRVAAILAVLAGSLAACSQNTDIRFERDQSWQLQSTLHYEAEWLEFAGGLLDAVVAEELGVSLPVDMEDGIEMLEYVFDLAKPEFAAKGIEFEASQTRETITLDFGGTQLASFNQLVPGAFVMEDLGDNQYRLRMSFLALSDLDPSLADLETLTQGFFQSTVTLHAGRIISSNADEVEGGTATWYNPTEIEVVFTPPSAFPPACLWGVGGLILVAAAVGIGFALRGQRCPMCGARAGKRAETCPKCGMALGDPLQNYDSLV